MEANEQDAAPETARLLQPCGAVGCCRAEENKSDYTPNEEPLVRFTAEQRAEFSAEVLEEFDAGCRERDRITCWEEAGHTVLAAINHATIHFVQACVTTTSHLSYNCRNSEDVDLPILIGGRVARGMAEHRILAPSKTEMVFFLQKARSDSEGTCDWCICARKLLRYNPDASDDELIAKWRHHWAMTVDLLDSVTGRCALDHLASALAEKKHISGVEVQEILGDTWGTIVLEWILRKQ
jgi:hypothetical protein